MNTSAIHGLTFSADDKLLYSADLSADKIWTHAVAEDGLASLVVRLDLPKAGMHPRHLAAHPAGKYLYVLMEHENTLVEYGLDEKTGVPVKELANYSLLPEGTAKLRSMRWTPLRTLKERILPDIGQQK